MKPTLGGSLNMLCTSCMQTVRMINTIDKAFKFCIRCQHRVYNSEWKPSVCNMLITHSILKMASNVSREVDEVWEERFKRERDRLRRERN